MAKEIKVEPVYKLSVKDAELVLTKTELESLRDTINKILTPETVSEEEYWALRKTLTVPPGVPRNLSPFAMAMLAVCMKHHKGYQNKAYARQIAEEIMKDYPEVAKFYKSKARLIFATIFAGDNGKGGGLVPAGLLKMAKDKEGNRTYWVD